MQKQLIEALADVLGIDLRDLQDMSEAQQLAHLEAMQSAELATV